MYFIPVPKDANSWILSHVTISQTSKCFTILRSKLVCSNP